jgi:hypothetical protein
MSKRSCLKKKNKSWMAETSRMNRNMYMDEEEPEKPEEIEENQANQVPTLADYEPL